MMMPMSRVALIVALAACVAAGAATPASVERRTIALHCSESGDICLAVVDRSGAVYLELAAAARYFRRYDLCVQLVASTLHAPADAARAVRCGDFPLLRRGTVWGSSVKYARQYPVLGRGTYRVTWKLRGRPLGPSLRFRLPLRR
jgi:hypothetical protein